MRQQSGKLVSSESVSATTGCTSHAGTHLFKISSVVVGLPVLMFRYVGAAVSEGQCDLHAPILSTSKVAFEWRIESTECVRHEVVAPLCSNIVQRGIPAPECSRRATVPTLELAGWARQSALRAQWTLREKLGRCDVEVACRYLGVAVPGGVDANAPAYKHSKVVFNWALQTPEWDWSEEASMRVKDVGCRDVPLPKCTVTRQRLVDLAKNVAQNASENLSLTVSCTYFPRQPPPVNTLHSVVGRSGGQVRRRHHHQQIEGSGSCEGVRRFYVEGRLARGR